MTRTLVFALLSATVHAELPSAAIRPVPRTILAVYDGRLHKDPRDTRIHRLASSSGTATATPVCRRSPACGTCAAS